MKPPSGAVTFLFTDIEGSTRRWEADAAAMGAALTAHDEVLREAIAAHGGWLFKHTGDGVCAAFDLPRAAVDAAVAAQRGLELPVRMGIATGEAELRGQDYFGVALNRAARVMAAGHGGQILLADSAAALLSGVDLIDLGLRRLRDLSAPVGVFQVRADGLRTEFPPLRTHGTSPGNLRPQATSFIGRESELFDIVNVVRSHRMVTLTGVGGVGKTRLALEVGERLGGEFPDGVWLFELAAVADPAAVPDAVAAVLGINQQTGKSLTDSVATALVGQVRLLVFDNCEHVLDATADLIDAILTRSPTVAVLATSREGIGLADEQLWPVPTLDTAMGADSAAARLFVERARGVAPHFSLADAAGVVDICQRLDGIPLAIELAASRMTSMTAGEVRDRLDQRFRLLVGSRRGLERHQTLRHAVAWSYELLSDAEKALLQRCSVFAGGFELASACAIIGSLDDLATLDQLDALVRKSLLIATRVAGRTRFSMLETIRQFAEEQLVANGVAADVRRSHARHFAAREAHILALWGSPRQREAYDWFAVELPNLRTAFRWAADHGDLDTAATIASYTAFVGTAASSYEPIAWAEELIAPAKAVDHPRLANLYWTAAQCWMPGRIEEAVRYSDAGQVEIDRGRSEVPFGTVGWLGAAYVLVGQPERMVEWCRKWLDRDSGTITRSCLVLALTFTDSADETMAAAAGLPEAAEAQQNPFAYSFALFVYGRAIRDVDPSGALDAFRRGFAVAQDTGNRFTEASLAAGLSRLQAEHGDPQSALDYFAVAIRNYRDAGNTENMRVIQAQLAVVLLRLGRHAPAATLAGFAISPLSAAAFPEINNAIGRLREALGDGPYESMARNGEAMGAAAIARFAFDQIDQVRAEMARQD
jgi:predicted ATPase/tetratricopeptide (TPR) repeat protein